MRRELLAAAAAASLAIGMETASAQQPPENDRVPSQERLKNQERLQNKEQDQGIQPGQLSAQKQSKTVNAGKAGELSADQRAKVHRALLEQNVEAVGRANFPVKVGARIPETVKHHQLPISVIDIAPKLRGYDYVRIGNWIAFVNPGTREIVALLSG